MTPPADVPKRSSTEAAPAREQPNIGGNASKSASEDVSAPSPKDRATTKSRAAGKPKDTQEATSPKAELPTVAAPSSKVENSIQQKQPNPTEQSIKEERPIKEESAKKELPATQVEPSKSASAASTPAKSTSESTTEASSSTVVPTGLPILAKIGSAVEPTPASHHPIVAAGVLARSSSPYLPRNRPIRPHESDEERSTKGLNLMGFLD